MWAVARAGGGGEGGRGGGGGEAGVLHQQYNTIFSSLLFLAVSMEACGRAVGVLEERKACGQWRGRLGAVRALRAVGAGGAGGRAGAPIQHYFLFSFVSCEYGSMWAVGAVGVLEERKACGSGEGGWGALRAVVVGRVARVGWGSNRTLFER